MIAMRTEPSSTGETHAEDGCPVCPHARDAHDPIASRFCAATAAGELPRGCACASGTRETRKEV
ncbi:hypothetical protein GCM10022222_05620 [Amycolatopsis ultiminotia]|uniref:Uncharacterized protein n=1 Tax=Amycolatopsis ultiminotia TaxID=543629 RepID=A0ABP6UYY0_9PSEU